MPTLQEKIEACLQLVADQIELPVEIYNSWECKFLESVDTQLRTYGSLTGKQSAIVEKLYKELEDHKTDGESEED